VEQLARVRAEQAGIQKRAYPHMLRHSYATWALNRGMNPIMLAQVLGHSSLVMIQRNYAHSTPADAHEMLAKLLAGD
jgi:integrase/recombinase XerD